jgi:hypothetical protein
MIYEIDCGEDCGSLHTHGSRIGSNRYEIKTISK